MAIETGEFDALVRIAEGDVQKLTSGLLAT
jgi:hypothetical protein